MPVPAGFQVHAVAGVLEFRFEVVDSCLDDAAARVEVLQILGLAAVSFFVDPNHSFFLVNDQCVL